MLLAGPLFLSLTHGCGLVLDADPPTEGASDGGTRDGAMMRPECVRTSDCDGCTACVAGACVDVVGRRCTVRGRCVAGIYECDADANALQCHPSDEPASEGSVCRPAERACDAPETCDGTSLACPADVPAAGGTPCDDGVCGDDGMCMTNTCTPGAPCDTGNECGVGVIVCDGGTRRCDETFVPAGTVCRASAGACDVDEVCDGASVACPTDGYADTDVPCRGMSDECDAIEYCTGAGARCPADGDSPTGASCPGGFCDGAGTCNTTCIPGDPCSTGNHCEMGALVCEMSGPHCVSLGATPPGTVCRDVSGPCDTAEYCDGTSTICPPDAFMPSTTECRASSGACDRPEACTGSSPMCPVDQFRLPTYVCRSSMGAYCDVPETCTGSGPTCPTNVFAPSGTMCGGLTLTCHERNTCSGISGACLMGNPLPADTTCTDPASGITGVCDLLGTCIDPMCLINGAPCSTCDSSTTVWRCMDGACRARSGPITDGCMGGQVCCASGCAVACP